MEEHWDLVVIGAGAGGLAGAAAAAERGLKVIVLETEKQVGGAMALSGGVFYAGGTSLQAKAGIDDSVDAFFHHYMDLNEWQLQPGLIHAFCEAAVDTLDWLLELGLKIPATISPNFPVPGIRSLGVEDARRGHIPEGEGLAVTQVLDRARRLNGAEVVFDTRVTDLIVEGGAVTGVVTSDGTELRAANVLVSSGGFARNAELLAKHFPATLEAGDRLFTPAPEANLGDHLGFAERADCSIVGDGWGPLLVCADFQRSYHPEGGYPPLARVLVDGTGRRFIDEDSSYKIMENRIRAAGGHAWAIFDEAAREGLQPGYPDWSPEGILSEVEAGRVHRGDTLADLAERIDVPPAALERTIARWNETLPHGNDPEFRRHESLEVYAVPDPPAPIDRGPFYAARMLPSLLIVTQTGIEIDEHARAIDTIGRPIPGLYAAGEAAGGIMGPHYVGALSIASAITMGRQAAIHAAGVAATATSGA